MEFEEKFLGAKRTWHPVATGLARYFFEKFPAMRDAVKDLANVICKASTDYMVLNDFLTEKKRSPMFSGSLGGIGAVAIIKIALRWAYKAKKTTLVCRNGKRYSAFEVRKGFTVFKTPHGPLVRIEGVFEGKTYYLWVKENHVNDPLDLVDFAFYVMTHYQRLATNEKITCIRLADVKIKTGLCKLAWLLGSYTLDDKDKIWFINQAFQEAELAYDQEGLILDVSSGVGMVRSMPRETPLELKGPVIGWLTQGDDPLPIAPFFAGYDAYQPSDVAEEDVEEQPATRSFD